MKTMRMASGLSALVVLSIASPLLGQGVVARAGACESGVVVGNLGISGLDCVGECTVTLSQGGKEENWVFSTEPRVFSIETGGPADGILRAGDHLVAIDGVLITTRAGGRRYANLQPGEVVTIRYRREGDLQEAAIRAGSRCTVPPEPSLSTGRVVPPPPTRPVAEPSVGIATAPRVRVLPSPKEPPPPVAEVPPVGVLSRGVFLDPTPRGRLGIGLACSHCGTQTDEETGEEIWYFSGPIEVTQVTAGGAADKAGIQIGDLITALDGHPLASEAGGRAFSSLKPGEAVRVTVQKKNGREVDLTVIPTEAEGLPLAGGTAGDFRNLQAVPEVADPPRSLGVAVAPPPAGPPDRAAFPEPLAGVMAGPDELPLRYSGTVSGVEVEVRGVPVAVSELQGARTLIINSEGLWIRIRIPAGTGGGEEKDGPPR